MKINLSACTQKFIDRLDIMTANLVLLTHFARRIVDHALNFIGRIHDGTTALITIGINFIQLRFYSV